MIDLLMYGIHVTAQTTPEFDPLNFFTSLGVGGSVSLVLYLWQRDTARQRDAAMKLAQDMDTAFAAIKPAMDRSTTAHERGSEAIREMTDLVKGMPPRETWTRVVDTNERVLRALDDDRRGRG